MNDPDAVAERIGEDIVDEITNYRRFRHEWDNIDPDDQAIILADLGRIASAALRSGDRLPGGLRVVDEVAEARAERYQEQALLLINCARAFLKHFNPHKLPSDAEQQYLALSDQCDRASAAHKDMGDET